MSDISTIKDACFRNLICEIHPRNTSLTGKAARINKHCKEREKKTVTIVPQYDVFAKPQVLLFMKTPPFPPMQQITP
jgi:hypothetical protein